MAHEVILMESVEGLGHEGEVVQVAEGYARNYLLPKQLAAPVNAATRKQVEKRRLQRAEELAAQRGGAEAMAARLEGVSVTITVKTGPEGQLYGSVGSNDVLAALKQQGVNLGKNQLELEQPFRELGVFTVPVHLHPEVKAAIKVWVVEE